MTTVVVVFVVALLAGLIFWLLRAEWRATNAMWSPHDPEAHGWTRVKVIDLDGRP